MGLAQQQMFCTEEMAQEHKDIHFRTGIKYIYRKLNIDISPGCKDERAWINGSKNIWLSGRLDTGTNANFLDLAYF